MRPRRSIRQRRSSQSVGLGLARRAIWIVLVGSIAAFVVLMGWSFDAGRLLRSLVLYNLAHVATACLCWWARADTRSSRRAWRLIAVAILLATASNVCFTLLPDTTGVVTPAVSDDLYLACYPIAIIALVLLVRDYGPWAVPAMLLDGLVVGLGSAAVVAALVHAPLLRLAPPVSAQAVTNLAYPVADLTLLTVLVAVGGATWFRVDPRPDIARVGAGHQPDHQCRLPSARPDRPLHRRRSRRSRLAAGSRSRCRRGVPR